SYVQPVATVITGASAMATAGSAGLTVSGTNFGPTSTASPSIVVTYGPTSGSEFTASSCTVTALDTTIHCTSAPGVGNNLKWIVTLGGQAGNTLTTTTSYAAPAVTTITGASSLATAVGAPLTITGTSFGPTSLSASFIVVTYGPSSGAEFT